MGSSLSRPDGQSDHPLQSGLSVVCQDQLLLDTSGHGSLARGTAGLAARTVPLRESRKLLLEHLLGVVLDVVQYFRR